MAEQNCNVESTEIRCEEKSRGGMAYDVVLAEPVAEKPAVAVVGSPHPRTPVTAEEIRIKLLQAEERRKSMEATRKASIQEKMTRLEEASQKRDQIINDFITSTQQALETKLDHTTSNREAYYNGLKAKMQEHTYNADHVRKQLETQAEDLHAAINSKLKSAEENRDENLNKMLEKLKEHEERVQKVRRGQEETMKTLDEKVMTKLNQAKTKRDEEMAKKKESLQEHDRHAEMVRANKEKQMNNSNNATGADTSASV